MTYTAHEARWFLAGYDTGEHVGDTHGYARGFAEGYDAGHTDGVRAGRERLHHEIAVVQRQAVDRAAAGLDAREAGAYLPGVAS